MKIYTAITNNIQSLFIMQPHYYAKPRANRILFGLRLYKCRLFVHNRAQAHHLYRAFIYMHHGERASNHLLITISRTVLWHMYILPNPLDTNKLFPPEFVSSIWPCKFSKLILHPLLLCIDRCSLRINPNVDLS